jgi:hypothetical protein
MLIVIGEQKLGSLSFRKLLQDQCIFVEAKRLSIFFYPVATLQKHLSNQQKCFLLSLLINMHLFKDFIED